jgi:hypothetical protein
LKFQPLGIWPVSVNDTTPLPVAGASWQLNVSAIAGGDRVPVQQSEPLGLSQPLVVPVVADVEVVEVDVVVIAVVELVPVL